MAIVLRRANGDIIWFDAITGYDTKYTASVTKHPVATGGFVSDHTTTDNVVLQINGIFSDADFNVTRQLIEVRAADGSDISKNKQYTNNTQTVYPVTIHQNTTINKILPEVVAQFTKDTIPNVYVTPQEKAKTALAVKRELVSMWKTREEFQVLDIVDNFVIDQFSPCVFTHLSFKEDETTGEGVFPNMTIEQVEFTDLQEVRVKIKTSNKGRKTGKVVKPEVIPPNTPNQPKHLSNKSAADVGKGLIPGGN
jgi:hypothetical protein